MKFYFTSRHLYLETDALGVVFEVGLLQVRDDINGGSDKVQDNITLLPNCIHQQKPIECWATLQQYKTWGPGKTTKPREVPQVLFC